MKITFNGCITALLLFAALSGCGGSSPETSAPPGMMQARNTGVAPGTQLWRENGQFFCTVLEVDPAHRFPNGKTGLGYRVEFRKNTDPPWVWVDGEVVGNAMFVRQ